MSTQNKLSTKDLIALILVMVLAAAGVVLTFLQFFKVDAYNLPGTVILLYLLVIFYAVYGYKIPHGNLLKWTFLLFSFLVSTMLLSGYASKLTLFILVIAILLIAYMAGRLNKIEKNKSTIIVVLVLLFIFGLISVLTPTILSKFDHFTGIKKILDEYQGDQSLTGYHIYFSPFIQFAVLSVSYIVRYNQHKSAGLNVKDE